MLKKLQALAQRARKSGFLGIVTRSGVVLFFGLLVSTISAGCVPPVPYRDSLDPQEEKISFIDVHGKSKNDAFVSAHTWVAQTFRSANDVIQMNDKDAGMLIVKSVVVVQAPIQPAAQVLFSPVPPGLNYDVIPYTMTLQIKNEKMKTEYMTGTISQGPNIGKYLPQERFTELRLKYKVLHDSMLQDITASKTDF